MTGDMAKKIRFAAQPWTKVGDLVEHKMDFYRVVDVKDGQATAVKTGQSRFTPVRRS